MNIPEILSFMAELTTSYRPRLVFRSLRKKLCYLKKLKLEGRHRLPRAFRISYLCSAAKWLRRLWQNT